jgi:excisionase family DNA binding protein
MVCLMAKTKRRQPLKNYSVKEVAKWLGFSEQAVQLAIDRKLLDAYQIPGDRSIRVTETALREFGAMLGVRS